MQDLIAAYHSSVLGLFVLAVLILTQLLIADVAGIRAKHIPGMPVVDGHHSFFFRSVRAFANSNENLGLFLLLFGVCILSAASARWVEIWVWVYVGARAGHMLCYYADQKIARSAAFIVGLIAELGLLVAAFQAL